MTGRARALVRAAVVVALGLVAFGLWLWEVLKVKGWPGLAWLNGYPYAAIGVVALVAVAILVVVGDRRTPARRFAAFLACATSIGLGCFELARESIFALYSRDHLAILNAGSLASRIGTVAAIAALPVAAVLAAVGIWAAVRFFLRRLTAWTILFLVVALGLVVPASMLTVRVFPALYGYTDHVHAVKMGYPVFWVVVLVAAAVALGSRFSAMKLNATETE
jgi:hypothetical protein